MRVDPVLTELQQRLDESMSLSDRLARERAERMCALKAEGWSLRELGNATGVSKQRVSKIVNANPSSPLLRVLLAASPERRC